MWRPEKKLFSMMNLIKRQKRKVSGSPLIVLYVPVTVLLAGCSKAPLPIKEAVIGRSVHGQPIRSLTIGTGPEQVLIGATIHGNEWAGTPLLATLVQVLQRQPGLLQGRTLTLLPVMNPDGYAHKIRTNAHGVDLNRNFPAKNRENTARFGSDGLTEPESQAYFKLFEKLAPARIVIIHQPLDVVDWDGPAEALAREMARFTHLPARRLGGRPGSMGSYYGVDKKIPIITYELPRHSENLPSAVLWNAYGRPLLSSIVWPGKLDAQKQPNPVRWDLMAPVLLLGGAVFVFAAITIMGQRRR